jgi:leucyl-tRNA synthetase
MKIINNRSILLQRRRELRNNPTQEESLLWCRLKNYQTGFKFRRQHSIGGYIVDFYCALERVVVEIDGSQHLQKENLEYDTIRSKYFESFNIKVVRFSNDEVNKNLDNVILKIKSILDHHPLPPPPKGGGVLQ